MKRRGKERLHVLGVATDNQDGHSRVTETDGVTLIGGSKESHEKMQEHAIKLGEEAAKRGKPVSHLTPQEFGEIADKLGMQRAKDKIH
jgi:hypothetical protein